MEVLEADAQEDHKASVELKDSPAASISSENRGNGRSRVAHAAGMNQPRSANEVGRDISDQSLMGMSAIHLILGTKSMRILACAII